MVTKNEGGKDILIQPRPGIVAIGAYFKFERVLSLYNLIFPLQLFNKALSRRIGKAGSKCSSPL